MRLLALSLLMLCACDPGYQRPRPATATVRAELDAGDDAGTYVPAECCVVCNPAAAYACGSHCAPLGEPCTVEPTEEPFACACNAAP